MVITHPFHPLKGQSLVVLFTQRRRHGLFFVCEVEGRRRRTWSSRCCTQAVAMSPTSKITASHLSRVAIVYVRQSTSAQVRQNTESTQRQ
jgi:hypothetical protein